MKKKFTGIILFVPLALSSTPPPPPPTHTHTHTHLMLQEFQLLQNV